MRSSPIAAIAILSTLSICCLASDHSGDYKMGTLTKVPLHVGGKVTVGFTDTTSCNSGLLGVRCTGGIVDDYNAWLVADMPNGAEVLIERCVGGASVAALLLPCNVHFILTLTEEDGTFVFLDKVWGSHDISQGLTTTSKVLYRTEHKPGVTFFKIPDPANPKKEGSYTPVKLPKTKAKEEAPTSPDNVSAMCSSGKLSAELQAKYCSPPNQTSPE